MKNNLTKLFNHSLFRSGLIYTITDAVNKSVPFFLLPVISYYLLPSDYGIITNFNVFISILSIFIGVGIDGAISVNFYKLNKKELGEYISNALLIVFCTTILVFIVVLIFQHYLYSYLKVPLKYQLLSVLMALSITITAVNLSLWRLEEKPLKFGIYELTQTVLNFSLSLYFIIILSLGWEGRIDAYLIASISYGLFSLLFIYKRGYLRFKINRSYILDALFFGLPLIPHSLSFWIRSGIDRIYITKMIDETATGLYATGFQFGILMSFLTMAFNNAFVPYLYKQLSTEDKNVLEIRKKKLVRLTYYILLGLILLCILLTLISNFLVVNILSPNYLEAKSFVMWAILAQTFQGMYLMFVNYIYFVKRTKLLAFITFSCSLLQLVLSYFFILKFGPLGAAYSTVIVSFINFIAVWTLSSKVYSMPWFSLKVKQ